MTIPNDLDESASNESQQQQKPAGSGPQTLDRLRGEMDRWLEAARSTSERSLETLGLLGTDRPAMPAVDITELADEVVVQVDLPGVQAESVALSLAGNMLTVSASRPLAPVSESARAVLRERSSPRFERAIPLPASVNADAIRAETRDGLLTVFLPKAVAGTSRTIPVARGGAK